jgi:perosamine synthetase
MKKIRWWAPQIGTEEKKFLGKVISSHFPNEGDLTARFEKKIASLLGVKHAVAVTSGTAALFLALKALGIGKGDEVIVPDVTFIATANAVELTGARSVLVDIDPLTLNISPEVAEKACTEKTRAILPVHVSGRGCNMKDIMRIAEKRGIYIVEDAAEAFMSKFEGQYLGTFGRLGCFSFSAHKTITTGQGGMVVTDDELLSVRLRELKDQGRPKRGTGGDDRHDSLGYNFKFTDLQAAVGLGQLKYLNSRLSAMRRIHIRYKKNLKGLDGISVFDFDTASGEMPQWTDAIAEDRDGLDSFLEKNNIDCRRFWLPVHTQIPYRLPDAGFPNSTALARKAIWLPSAFTMTTRDVDYVCDKIKDFYKR